MKLFDRTSSTDSMQVQVTDSSNHTHGNIVLGRTPPDEGSTRRRGLYLCNKQHAHGKNIHESRRVSNP